MLKVFKILSDFDHCHSLQYDEDESRRSIEFTGIPLEPHWRMPLVYSRYPTRQIGDFWDCAFWPGIFAVTHDTAEMLSKFLRVSCELLPLAVEDMDEELLVCHTTRVMDCLDLENSEIDEGTNWIDKHAYHCDRLGPSLFKTPQDRRTETLCWEDSNADPEESFRGVVETRGLTGLRFKEVWSSESA